MADSAPVSVAKLGRYQVLKHLATGGMAEVLLARGAGAHGFEHVVIKRIRPEQAKDEHFVRMFLDEARLAASLHHGNIVTVHEIGEDRGEYFFSMEYVHGEDLRGVLREVNRQRDRLPIAMVTGIVAAAAAGLHHAHETRGPDRRLLGIVHRDVSPANILVAYDGRVKVADFGIAKAALRTVETRSGTLKGKVSYMSPEQVTGKPVDRRSDIFALGIVLYEVATARRLFKGENDFLTMTSIVQGEIPPPSLLRQDLPRPLEEIIMKALAHDPDERYQTMQELHADLEQFTHSIGMRLSTASVADYMRKLFGARPEPWLVAEGPKPEADDFDLASGLVTPPQQGEPLPKRVRPSPTSPLMHARSAVTGEPMPAVQEPVTPPSGTPMAWPRHKTELVGSRSRRRWMAIGGIAVAAIAGSVLVVGRIGGHASADDEPHAQSAVVPMKAAPAVVETTPPPPPPEPEPAPAPPPKPEPEPAPVAKPIAKVQAQKPVAKPAVKKIVKRPAPNPEPKKWDPDALFPK